MELTPQQKRQNAAEIIEMAHQGIDVSHADPRESSMEAVIMANKILRAQGSRAINLVQSGL